MPAAGDFIGKFRVIRLLGEGGMGSVFLAQDSRVKPPRMVAIKMLKDHSSELRERFGREVGIVANFEHPNIVHVFEVDEHDGHPFMAMAYVKGETLLEIIRRRAAMAFSRRLEIIEGLCAGLAYAHRQGVVHRDIKPGNVMVDSEDMLKILDFGIAKLADSTLTASGNLIGTPNYMSPEQISGRPVGPPSDVFAVGTLFYELLTYRKAFPAKMPEVLGQILESEPEPLLTLQPLVDPGIVEILERALKKNPDERYQDLAVMQRELAKVRKRMEAASDEATFVDAPRRQSKIEPLLSAARDALTAGDLTAARARAAEVLEIDTQNAEAIAIDQSAHVRQVEQQTQEWLERAQKCLAADNLTGADELVEQILRQSPKQPEAIRLRADLMHRRQQRDDASTVRRTANRALARARAQIADGAFEAGARTLDEVFVLIPNEPEALELLEQARAGGAVRGDETPMARTLETVRVDIQTALQSGNIDRAEELTRQLAAQGADARDVDDFRTSIVAARHDATIVAPAERKPMSEAMRVERTGLRAFYRAKYEKAIEAFERIPQNATGDLSRDRILFYLACSNAALALLEGTKGEPRLAKAKALFKKSQPDKNPFAVDRKYVSPGIIRALET